MATKINVFNSILDTSKINHINFNHFKIHPSSISQLVKPVFNKIKELSSKHLGEPTYLLVNQEDMVAKKIAKICSWVFGISPLILLGAYAYDHLVDLYHQHVENYSRMEEYPHEISERLDSSRLQFPKDQSVKIEPLPEYIIPKILKPSISINDDISDTRSQTDVESDLGEDNFELVFEEEVTANDSTKIFSSSPNTQELTTDVSIVENSKKTDEDIPNSRPDSLDNNFEKIDMTSELLEEMKNSPEMPSPYKGVAHRIIEIAKGIKAFWANNPFTSNKPNLTNTLLLETEPRELSYKDFEISNPIIISHKDTKIDTTTISIEQIKKDIPRMKFVVNGKQCLNIRDFTNQLGLTLNEDETDILPTSNPIIPRLLHFAHQGLLANATGAFFQHVMKQDSDKMPIQITDREDLEDLTVSIDIQWDPMSLHKPKLIGKTPFYITSPTDMRRLPHAYMVKTECSLDQEEITSKNIGELPKRSDTNSFASITEKIEQTELDENDFEDISVDVKNLKNINYNWDIAFNHLLNKQNDCLNSTVTSEYLKSLKTKHSAFAYEDRLMFPGSITTDEIVTSLNKLKNNNSTNQTIFLPFLVKGWTVDHAVVAVLNPAEKTIEYFDPKGQSSIWPARTEKQSNKNVFDFLTELGQKFISPTFSKEKIVYNKKNIPQGFSDNINCGAFCLQFIEERITRSFNDIENDLPLDPKALRRQLANKLVENTHSNSI